MFIVAWILHNNLLLLTHEYYTNMRERLEPEKLEISLKPEDMVGKFHVEEKHRKDAILEKAKERLISGLSRGYFDYIEKESLEGVDNVRNEEQEDDDHDYRSNDNDGYEYEWERKKRLSQIPSDLKSSPEVQQAAREGMLICLSNGNIDQAIEIKDTFSLGAETLYSPQSLSAIQEEITRLASYENVDGVNELVDKLFTAGFPQQLILEEQERVFSVLLAHLLERGQVRQAIEVKNKLSIGERIIASAEVQNALKGRFTKHLLDRDLNGVEWLREQFSLTSDFISSPEVQEAAQKLLTRILSRDNYNITEAAIEIRSKFSLSVDNLHEAAKAGIAVRLSKGNVHNAIEIRDKLEIPTEIIAAPEVLESAKAGILYCLNDEDGYNHVENATLIKNSFAVPAVFFSSPDMQQAVQKILTKSLSSEYTRVEDAIKFKNEFFLSESATLEATTGAFIEQILKNRLHNAINIRQTFSLPESVVQNDPKVLQAARKAIISRLQGSYKPVDEALEVAKYLSLPTEINYSPEVQQVAEKKFLDSLAQGDVYTAVSIKDSFALPTTITSSVNVETAVKKGIAKCLSKGEDYKVSQITEKFPISIENMQEAAKEGMIGCVSAGNISGTKNIQNQFNFSKEVLMSAEVQQAATKGMQKCLSDGSVSSAVEIKDVFFLPLESVAASVKTELIKCLSKGSVNNAVIIKNRLVTSPDVISAEEVVHAAKQGLTARLAEGNIADALIIRDQFPIPSDFIVSTEMITAAEKGIAKSIAKAGVDNALKIREAFLSDKEVVERAVCAGLNKLLLESGQKEIENAFGIANRFSLPKETILRVGAQAMADFLSLGSFEHGLKVSERFSLSSEEVSKAAKRAFLICVGKEQDERAEKIQEKFKVSPNSEDILEFFPEMRKLLTDLQSVSPEFVMQAEKTPDLLLNLLEFRQKPEQILSIVKENPFLLDAVVANPRFGSRLMIKYPQFDQISKENIRTQHAIKKKILAENSDIDPQTVEFRKLMQDSLVEYGVNKKVLEDINAKGVNSERWLNYDETGYFNLGSNENTLAFSEIITTPIGRIKETIDLYAHTIKEVLNEYRTELLAFEVSLGRGELPTEELKKMTEALEKAKSEGNLKKAAGIEKGIENLKGKFSQERKGVLWEKLLADVASFQRLKDDVFKAQEVFVATEKELESAVMEKMPSGKRIQEIKRKMGGAKEDLRGKFMVMERRIEEFRGNLKTMIAPALGNDRSAALIQEINTKLAEQFNHFDTDRSMLKNLFSEQSDKRKEEMESRPMSIFVWTRDPDVDLYQGNYSPCCICIDSQYHGAESPIADYNIDLGIQIVNVWDEVKNEPVTAAWCWLGEDEKGETVLVVDNIESNTFYSANFSEQFTNELFKYIKNYAKEVGVKKVVLGKANNDLPTAGELSKLPEDTGKYKKVGGASRSDGYFLEAEDRSVKTIWEKGVKSESKKTETGGKKSERERVVFSEVATYPLDEEDFRPMRELERRVYANDSDLIQGLELVHDIKAGNGLEYSVATWGVPQGMTKQEMIAYIVAVEDETDEGDKSVYLEDIAVAPEAQRQGIGQKLIQELMERLKTKANSEGEPVLFDMHLRPNSLALLDRQRQQLTNMGVVLLEDVLVPDYYDEGEDAVYRVYEVSPNRN